MLSILLVLLIVSTQSWAQTAQLKGNIIFESPHQASVTINPHYIQFNRRFDLSIIKEALDLLDTYTLSYSKYCNEIIRDRKRNYNTFKVEGQKSYPFTTCKNNSGHLPEVRTEDEASRMVELLQVLSIQYTPAGLEFDSQTNKIKYARTGDDNTYHWYLPCPDCKKTDIYTTTMFNETWPDKTRKILMYAVGNDHRLYIKLAKDCRHNRGECEEGPMLCSKGSDIDTNVVNTLVSHACTRDSAFINQTNTFLRYEYEGFLHPLRFPNNRRRRSATITRRKRFVALPWVIGGAVGGGIIASAITNTNPFTFIGEVVGGVFGLATKQDLQLTHDMIKAISTELTAVKTNQKQLTHAINNLRDHTSKLEKMILYQAHDTAVMYGELDSKVSMRYLQSVIQISLLKVHATIVAARQFKPSPFVFGAQDLEAINADRRYSKKHLTNDIERVSIASVISENAYSFLIAIPIIEEKTQFHLYKLIKLPIFHNQHTYNIQTQNLFYAINHNTNEYIILKPEQFQMCSLKPMCSTNGLIFSLTKNSPCELTSFLQNKQICPLEATTPESPAFINYANTTYYSVPTPHQIYVRCSQDNNIKTQHETIEGIGLFQTHTGCTTQVTESAQIRPIHVAEIHDLESNSVFGILKQFDFSAVTYPPLPYQNTTTFKPITLLEANSFQEGLDLILSIQTTSTDVARIFLILIILVLIFIIIYKSCKTFRLWFNDCCSFTKPHKYWGRKYDNVPHFIKTTQNKINPLLTTINKSYKNIKSKFIKPITPTTQENEPNPEQDVPPQFV